jgi:hypothetical protein
MCPVAAQAAALAVAIADGLGTNVATKVDPGVESGVELGVSATGWLGLISKSVPPTASAAMTTAEMRVDLFMTRWPQPPVSRRVGPARPGASLASDLHGPETQRSTTCCDARSAASATTWSPERGLPAGRAVHLFDGIGREPDGQSVSGLDWQADGAIRA